MFRENIIFGFQFENKIMKQYFSEIENIIQNSTSNLIKERFKNKIAWFLDNNRKKLDGIINYINPVGYHPVIPIVLNHPKGIRLRWCHANYAAIPTKNGYNVLEMIT